MQVVENRTTETVHLPGEKNLTLCGKRLVADGQENARFRDDQWLDEFPEDFGISMNDCERCAEMADLDE